MTTCKFPHACEASVQVYGVLPAATAFMVYYSWLSSYFSKKWLFYVTAAPFMVFYALFAWVLYPNRALIHPALPKGLDERWQVKTMVHRTLYKNQQNFQSSLQHLKADSHNKLCYI